MLSPVPDLKTDLLLVTFLKSNHLTAKPTSVVNYTQNPVLPWLQKQDSLFFALCKMANFILYV